MKGISTRNDLELEDYLLYGKHLFSYWKTMMNLKLFLKQFTIITI